MPSYMFLLYGDEAAFDDADEASIMEEFQRYEAFEDAVRAAGARIIASEALEATSTATTVRTGAAPLVTDGPFADTKEALGGFYLLEVADLDAALELARRCPAEIVELRPVMAMPDDH